MKLGEVIIIQKDNPYHDWDVRKSIERMKVKINREKWAAKNIRKYKYSGILDEKEVLWLVVGAIVPGLKNEIESIRLKKRSIIFEVETKAQKDWVLKMTIDGKKPRAYENVVSWDEKKQGCLKMVARMRTEIDSAETRNKLLDMMIRDPESWKDVELGLRMVRNKGRSVTLRDLQDIYPTMDFYRLDDWIRDVIEGKKKQKTIKVAHYFTDYKEYSSVWLMQKVREKVRQISCIYDGYRKGILYGKISKSQIMERSTVKGWTGVNQVIEMKDSEISYCLRLIKDLPYKYFIDVQKIVFSGKEIVDKDWDIYWYIETLRHTRGLHDGGNRDGIDESIRKYQKRRKG